MTKTFFAAFPRPPRRISAWRALFKRSAFKRCRCHSDLSSKYWWKCARDTLKLGRKFLIDDFYLGIFFLIFSPFFVQRREKFRFGWFFHQVGFNALCIIEWNRFKVYCLFFRIPLHLSIYFFFLFFSIYFSLPLDNIVERLNSDSISNLIQLNLIWLNRMNWHFSMNFEHFL